MQKNIHTQFYWKESKNSSLKEERGISFEDVLAAISQNGLIDIIPHHDQNTYSNQKNLVIIFQQYIWYVPYEETSQGFFLKTIIPSRKLTKKYFTLLAGKSGNSL